MFQRMNFKKKMYTLPILFVAAFLVMLGFILNISRSNSRQMNQVVNGYVPAWQMSRELLVLLESIQRGLQDAVNAADRDFTAVDKMQSQAIALIENERKNSVIPKAELDDIKARISEYYTLARETSQRLITRETGENLILSLERMQNQFNSIRTRLDANVQRDKDNMAKAFGISRNNITKLILGSLVIALMTVVAVFLLTRYINKTVTDPLNIAIDVAKKVSDGDLTVNVPLMSGEDESSVLLRTFRKMVDNLRMLTEQMKEAVNALSSASTEISASVTEIASGATETATAANETSTTVEEVRQTAMDSNRKAKFVSESAQKAVQISQAGEKAVAGTIDGMRRIERQMESIAESIMKLSEHGQAIGGIIATVEDVAEQSNLLAVNASIEAARAGEHGKGFAVVAQEVKSLAEQSKQATSKVRNILDDIQKATSGAVMTTEQGTKAVEAGVKQSTESGESIQRLANSVSEAAQATTQISVSSQEQVVGMDQVVSAMESIKQASSQNVTATRQVETAAHDLQELGQRLKHLVEQYRL